MKKLFIYFVMFLMSFTTQAQRCAVLEFKAGVGVSQNDVDGISSIFITYFRPDGYTTVERTHIDEVIEEQGFQRSKMTEEQMVRVGKILNVSKVVVGDINIVMEQYNVDVRVINVESGIISATEGATFTGASYRSHMQSIAQKLASKIAITSGGSVQASPKPTTTTPMKRTSVEVLYGYLKIFPNELGTFDSEPTSVISQINRQAQHGYNNWRIPTNEELSLLKANNYLGSGDYMTRESRKGKVLLVSDGKEYATLAAESEGVFDYNVVEIKPSFPGGDESLYNYLSKNILYPEEALIAGIQGRVHCSFIVEKDGSISHVKVVKNYTKELDDEAVRVLSLMPKWTPGKIDGKYVRVRHIVVVTFRIP